MTTAKIKLRRPAEIAALRASGRIVAEAFALIGESIRPGLRLRDLDRRVADHIRRRGARPLYKGYRGTPPSHPPFPGVICTSVNDEICHGLPDDRVLKDGDIVAVDIGLTYRGFCGDACVTYAVGRPTPEARRLLAATEDCLRQGIAAAQPGRRLSDIGAAIEACAAAQGFGVVREWGGHGIGRDLHEPPSVPHVGPPGRGPRLRPGMVFTIEPMITAGSSECAMLPDGWTMVTADGSLSAQFEHTIAIADDGPQILSAL